MCSRYHSFPQPKMDMTRVEQVTTLLGKAKQYLQYESEYNWLADSKCVRCWKKCSPGTRETKVTTSNSSFDTTEVTIDDFVDIMFHGWAANVLKKIKLSLKMAQQEFSERETKMEFLPGGQI